MTPPVQKFRGFSQQIKFRVAACSDLITSTTVEGGLKGTVACHHDMRPGQEFVAVDASELAELQARHTTLVAENERLHAMLEEIGSAAEEIRRRLAALDSTS